MTLEWLNDCKLIAKEISQLEEQIARLESALTSVTRSLGDGTGIVLHGSDPHKMERMYAELEVLRDRRINRIIFLENERDRADSRLNILPRQQQLVVREYYFSPDKWKDVAPKLGWSENHCRHIAAAASKRLYENYAV